jgi:LemA protein
VVVTEPLTVLLLGLLALVVGAVLSYNRFVSQRTSIDAAWAGIDVELQRRHDLVPNLVETVQGYATHERALLDAVVQARAEAHRAVAPDVDTTRQARAEDELTDRLTGLFALAESHPQLRADRVFADLQRQLIETEDRIAASRRLYNLEVAAYERRRAAVPSNVVAWALELPARDLFEIRDPAAAHRPLTSF